MNCVVKLLDENNDKELMEMLGLKETFDKMAMVNGLLWYGHVVRRDDGNVLKKALMLEVNAQRNRGRPKQIWRRQVKENVNKIGLEGTRLQIAQDVKRERAIAEGMRCIQPPLIYTISVENKPVSLLVPLAKARDGTICFLPLIFIF